jgi:hypothetical protein
MEQAQIAQLNERLIERGEAVTAADLGLDGAADRTLREVRLEGSPSFGYVWGLFAVAGGDIVRTRLHADDLRAISAALRMPHHHWDI